MCSFTTVNYGHDSNTGKQNRCFPTQTTSKYTEYLLVKNYQQPKSL